MSTFYFPLEPPDGLNVLVDEFGCWLWQGSLDGKGYGPIRRIWEQVTGGERLPGFTLDHVCRRRSCVFPRHLEPVSNSENQRRKSARYRRLSVGHCPFNHRLTAETILVTPEEGRVCKVCMTIPELWL